jgi:hypothetical protein
MNKPCIFRHLKLVICETCLTGIQSSDHNQSDMTCQIFQHVVTVPGERAIRYEVIRSTCWMQPFILIRFVMRVFVWHILYWKWITYDARCKMCNVISCSWFRTPLLVWMLTTLYASVLSCVGGANGRSRSKKTCHMLKNKIYKPRKWEAVCLIDP